LADISCARNECRYSLQWPVFLALASSADNVSFLAAWQGIEAGEMAAFAELLRGMNTPCMVAQVRVGFGHGLDILAFKSFPPKPQILTISHSLHI
jgi:hypothetical protein